MPERRTRESGKRYRSRRPPRGPADGLKPEIDYDTFAQVELRVAEVLACEKIPKADKLLG